MLIFTLWFSLNLAQANLGHRACGDFQTVPENTIASVTNCLVGSSGEAIQDDKDFLYLEFDVMETRDNKLVLFHDKYLGSNFNRPENLDFIRAIEQRTQKNFAFLSIKDLFLSELKQLVLKGDGAEVVPSLAEFFAAVRANDLRKPLVLEIKYVYSDRAWLDMVRLMEEMKDYMDQKEIILEEKHNFPGYINFLAFKHAVRISLGWQSPRHRFWCNEIESRGLGGIFRAIWHNKDYCSGTLLKLLPYSAHIKLNQNI